ncbi:MAG: hypothetical protein OYG31_03240 [Candidatus Kaiserbacteria bacterium]|nr:hypothetical protein [Candidatus Kaiserbacteria bacterium]
MELKEAGPLITILLLFVLVVGMVVIYSEEILESEAVARFYNPYVPDIATAKPSTAPSSGSNGSESGDSSSQAVSSAEAANRNAVSIGSFTETQRVRFGNGRVVDSDAKDIPDERSGNQAAVASALHTISGRVNDYYLRGALDIIQERYQPSPYAGSIIFLDRSKNLNEYRPEFEYFILSVADSVSEPISITGWKVFDHKEKISYAIPTGKELFGSLESKNQSIRVSGGDIVIVSSGQSPTGFSFRLNKCSGFRSQFKQFVPSIKTACPKPIDEFIADGTIPYTDNACYETVQSLRECETVTEVPDRVTLACRRFLEHSMNEQGCIELHRNDADFYVPEWRVFLGSGRSLWEDREKNILYLVDEEDRLVATLMYN